MQVSIFILFYHNWNPHGVTCFPMFVYLFLNFSFFDCVMQNNCICMYLTLLQEIIILHFGVFRWRWSLYRKRSHQVFCHVKLVTTRIKTGFCIFIDLFYALEIKKENVFLDWSWDILKCLITHHGCPFSHL